MFRALLSCYNAPREEPVNAMVEVEEADLPLSPNSLFRQGVAHEACRVDAKCLKSHRLTA